MKYTRPIQNVDTNVKITEFDLNGILEWLELIDFSVEEMG
jgi:hypothetical protein